ncbi:MAG TPA: hypothetical protein VMU93_14865 [Caulobacteraceae bacterium]|nr:hypothetical protein [Caulobacteraceae bacterium]
MRLSLGHWRPLVAAFALLVGACATTERIEAAGDVHALLVAIRDGDRAGFDAHVDRAALERQLQDRILARTAGPGADAASRSWGVLIAGPLSRLAGGLVLRPQVFAAVAEYYGYRPGQPIPGRLAIAGALRPVGEGRVCAAKGRRGPCLMTFADEAGVWRLVSFDGDVRMLRLPA